jgi:hypothetical protein
MNPRLIRSRGELAGTAVLANPFARTISRYSLGLPPLVIYGVRSVVHFRDSVEFTNSEHEVRSSYLLR